MTSLAPMEAMPAAQAPAGPYAWQRVPPRTVGVGRRAAAFVVDLAIVFVLAWTATFAAAASGVLSVPDVAFLGHTHFVLGLLWLVSVFELPLVLVYFTLFEALAGRTPGKLLAGLVVRRTDGEAPTLFDAFLRNLLRLLWVTPFGPIFVLLDAWSLATTELDQRMGDLVADTVVVDLRGW